MEQEEPQAWTPPKDAVPVAKKSSWAPPSDAVPVKKDFDFTHGYKPTPEDIKTKKSFDDLEASFDRDGTTGLRPVTKFAKTAPHPTKPMQVEGITRHANSWENLGDFVPNTVLGGLQKDAGGALQYLAANVVGKKKVAPGVHTPQNDAYDILTKLGKGLEGYGKEHEKTAQQHQLPQTTGGQLAQGATGFVPDLLELAVTPELDIAKVGKLGEVLTKYGGKYAPKIASTLVGKFPTQQAAKGLAEGFSEGKSQGMSDDDATQHALKEGLKGYGKGVLFDGAGELAGKASELGSKLLKDKGLLADGLIGKAQKAIIHSAAQATAFSAVPFVTNAIEGKPTTLDELKQNAIFGGVTGLFHIPGQHSEEDVTPSDGAAKEVLQRSPLIDLHNFMTADMDAIKDVHESGATPADLQVKAAVHANDAFKSEDPETKQQEIVASGTTGKMSSVKAMSDAILKDKDAVHSSIDELPVSDETKAAIHQKIDDVHKELDPTEQKKTELGKQVQQKDEQIAKLGEKTDDPVKNAENEVNLEQAKKDREELNNELKNVILKQKEHETKNEGRKSGLSATTEKGESTGETIGEQEHSLPERGSTEQEGLTQGGEEPPLKDTHRVYDEIPELKKIGSKKEYESHIKNIFPKSAVSRILYHGSDEPIENFKPSEKGIYFSEDPDYWPDKKHVYAAKVNIENPEYGNTSFIEKKPEGKDGIVWTKKDALEFFKDDEATATPEGKEKLKRLKNLKDTYEAVVFDPKQIHVLGSEKDINEFKKYKDAVQEPKAEGVPVQSEAQNSEGVSKEDTKGEKTANKGKKEKVDETAPTKENGNAEGKANKENIAETSTGDKRIGSSEGENEKASERVKPTSIKRVINDAVRADKELPEVEVPKLGKRAGVLQRGKKLVGTGEVKPDEVIERVISGKGIYTPDEASAMQYHMHQLRTEETNLRKQLDDVNKKLESVPNDQQHKNAKVLLEGNLRQLDDRTELATRANRINSRSWSNLGNTMQIEADDTFSPANIRAIIKDNYNGEIPKDVQVRLDAAIKERDKAISDLKKATENATTKQGRLTVEKIRKSVGLIKQSKAELEAEAEQLKKDLRSALKSDVSRVNSGIPIPTETLAVLGKLAVNYFKQGVKDFEGLVNRIHSDLSDTDIDKTQLREYLSNYEPLRDESKERRVELLGRKERSLNKQLETGNIRDYSRKPEIVFKKDNEVIKAEQRVKDAEFKIKQEKAKSYNKTKSGKQRALDYIIRWERRFVLSSPAILAKLAAAVTVGGGLRRIPEEIIGGMWTKMVPAIMDKAPIEGGFNAKAEAAYWKDFSNPKKFFHNAKEILKTGASDLTKEFSDKPHEHYQYYDALTDLHPIIKDVSKRSTYEASLVKGLNWAEKNGLDISDPLIRQNIKQQAYNRAEYEIFQENSGWNRRLQNFLNDDRTPNNNKEMLTRFATRFLMPVSTVPLNIARRIGNYATGLPRGLINVREAYKAGVENLSNEQAEIIAKQLKQGTMGAALFSMGLFGVGGSYGGFYNKDDRSGLDRTGPFDPGFDEMYFGKQKVPKAVQHALPLQLIQLGATYRNIYKLYMDKYETSDEYNTELEKQMKSQSQAAMVSAMAIAEQVPLIEEPFEFIGAFKDPYMRKKFAEGMKRRVTPTIVSDAAKLVKK